VVTLRWAVDGATLGAPAVCTETTADYAARVEASSMRLQELPEGRIRIWGRGQGQVKAGPLPSIRCSYESDIIYRRRSSNP
jgi:hypothetical protein